MGERVDADVLLHGLCARRDECTRGIRCSRCGAFALDPSTPTAEAAAVFAEVGCRAPHFTNARLHAWREEFEERGTLHCPCYELPGHPEVRCTQCPQRGLGYYPSDWCPASGLFQFLTSKLDEQEVFEFVSDVWADVLDRQETLPPLPSPAELVRRVCVLRDECPHEPGTDCTRCPDYATDWGVPATMLVDAYLAVGCRGGHFNAENYFLWVDELKEGGLLVCPCGLLDADCRECSQTPYPRSEFPESCPASALFEVVRMRLGAQFAADLTRRLWEQRVWERAREVEQEVRDVLTGGNAPEVDFTLD